MAADSNDPFLIEEWIEREGIVLSSFFYFFLVSFDVIGIIHEFHKRNALIALWNSTYLFLF